MKIVALMFPLAVFLVCSGCGSPRVAQRSDPEITRNAAAARTSYANGMIESAAVFYQKALDRARLANQSKEIAALAYNLAACRAQMQQYPQALALLDEAAYESSANGISFPEVIMLRAEVLRRLDRTDEAVQAVAAYVAKAKSNDPLLVQMKVFLAEVACDRSNGKLALRELDSLDRGLLNKSDALMQARAAVVRGRAQTLEKKHAAAAEEYDRAAMLYQKTERYLEMANALQSSADALAASGNNAEASERYFRAARAFGFGGKNEYALVLIERAEEMARTTGNVALTDALARLKPDIVRNTASNVLPAKAKQN